MSVEAATSSPVNLTQLAAEMGGAQLSACQRGSTTTVTALDDTPQDQLDTALVAHRPAPDDHDATTAATEKIQKATTVAGLRAALLDYVAAASL